jgi:hypothetical protein
MIGWRDIDHRSNPSRSEKLGGSIPNPIDRPPHRWAGNASPSSRVWVAVETARQQDWEPCVGFVVGPVACLGNVEFDIVLCNMIAANFLPLVAELRNLLAPRGVVVFSGMLASDVEAVSESLESAGLSVLSENGLGEWVSMLATRATAR